MTNPPKLRGFAAMSPEKRKLFQSMGGKASPTTFSKGDGRAKLLGSKGGKVSRRIKKDV